MPFGVKGGLSNSASPVETVADGQQVPTQGNTKLSVRGFLHSGFTEELAMFKFPSLLYQGMEPSNAV